MLKVGETLKSMRDWDWSSVLMRDGKQLTIEGSSEAVLTAHRVSQFTGARVNAARSFVRDEKEYFILVLPKKHHDAALAFVTGYQIGRLERGGR